MTALTGGRNTPQAMGDLRSGPVAAATRIYQGAIVMRTATGHLTKGATATGSYGVGRAEALADNTAGAAGAIPVTYRPGIFRFANLAGDAVTIADIGKPCYVVDDQTVARTNGTNTRSLAGFVDGIDDDGVWVRFDEALIRLV